MILFFYFLFAYCTGNILFGFIISKFLANKDIRKEGSRNAGARNAGRLYGKKAFIFTFFGDALKGAFIVYLGRLLGYSTSILLLGLLFACAGHIKPIFFQWKGGKGISSFIGGMITIQPIFIFIILAAFLLFYLIYRSFTVPGLLSLAACCVSFLFLEESLASFFIATMLMAMIVLSHNIPLRHFIQKKSNDN
ncbi:glycerol-3-phosphate acyltransferase [Niallia sp. NCCP-28]|uniref:glycerol-3-phosphate acyltransferase n=1 Tax=Niallia sp. NCCP-28 TaxID=2934712 RepID=UPI0035CF0756